MNKIVIILLCVIILAVCQIKANRQPEQYTSYDFDQKWDYNHPGSTEELFLTLLDSIDTRTSGYDKSYHLQLLTQIARAKGLQGQFESGHQLLDQVKRSLDEKTDIARIRYLLERGRLFYSAGEKDSSLTCFTEAWDFGIGSGNDLYSIDAAHMLGIVADPDQQLSWNLKALELAEKSPDPRAANWKGPLYNNIGWTYHDLGKNQEALQMFKKDLRWRQEIGDESGARISRWSLARTYRSLKEYDIALDMQLDLKKEVDELQLPEDGYIYEELGELYLLKDENDLAVEYFGLAYDILKQDPWLEKFESDRLARLKNLGKR